MYQDQANKRFFPDSGRSSNPCYNPLWNVCHMEVDTCKDVGASRCFISEVYVHFVQIVIHPDNGRTVVFSCLVVAYKYSVMSLVFFCTWLIEGSGFKRSSLCNASFPVPCLISQFSLSSFPIFSPIFLPPFFLPLLYSSSLSHFSLSCLSSSLLFSCCPFHLLPFFSSFPRFCRACLNTSSPLCSSCTRFCRELETITWKFLISKPAYY